MEDLGYYNGKYDRIERMTVPMNDRACFFGDGIYEALYCRNYKIFALQEHLERLYVGAETLGIVIPHTRQEMADLLYSLIGKVDSPNQLIYLQISRGTQMRNHAPAEGLVGNVWVILRQKEIQNIYIPMRLITVEDTRFSLCHIKTLNLLPTVLASAAAAQAGADEAVFHRGALVTECAHSNIAIIDREDRIRTAPADCHILAGIARAHFLRACEALGFETVQEHFSVEEMMRAKEIVVISSGTLCRPASLIDGIPVGGGAPDMLRALQDHLMQEYLTATE